MKKINLFKELETQILNLQEISDEQRNDLLKKLMKLKNQKANILITGATGSGKSSTINALFDTEVAKVGVGVDPETMDIEKYTLDNLVLWDSPGLGDGKEADVRHARNIIDKLVEVDSKGNALIDLVLVILDGSSRDMGTSYELINNVIIPNLGERGADRILVAINQADMAMKGKYWDDDNNKPMPQLIKFLDEKVDSVARRIKDATGVEVEPIYYCAGYKEEGMPQCKPYNLSKLLYYIVSKTPSKKRAVYANNINQEPEVWQRNDELIAYGEETSRSILDTIAEAIPFGKIIVGAGKLLAKGIKTIFSWGRSLLGGIFGF